MTDRDLAIIFTTFFILFFILFMTIPYLLTLRFAPPLARLEHGSEQAPAIEVTVAHSPLQFICR